MQNWVIIDEKYLNYLRNEEARIPYSNYGANHFKPFFGVLFQKGDLAYVTQISHAQPRHQRMKNSPDFQKIYLPDKNPALPDRLVAVVNLNYMFPVPSALLQNLKMKDIDQHRTFRSEKEKSAYIDLLNRELAVINQLNLEAKAQKLYQLKQSSPDYSVSKRCLDFSKLESLAAQYPASPPPQEAT